MSAAGELVAGKYRITRKLDGGGMADVFLARVEGAAGFARTVVLKRLVPTYARDPEVVAMFLDEARIAARLHHGNIAQVFDFGSDADGYYLAMEFLSGRDAHDLMRAAHGRLPLSAAAAIVAGAAAGLHHAHEQRDDAGQPLGIVHRDVTSANLFVTRDGGVKVIDFGIARAADRLAITRAGTTKGTTAYMSPEQVFGAPVDRRSDVWQLGVVLYELATGARPFDRSGDPELAIARRIEAGAYPPAREVRAEVPADLDALLRQMIATSPASRLPTAEQVSVELDALARRHGWSMSAHELATVVRELAPVPVAGDAPDTDVDPAPADPAPRSAEVETVAATPARRGPAADDRAAILAGLAAGSRNTAPVETGAPDGPSPARRAPPSAPPSPSAPLSSSSSAPPSPSGPPPLAERAGSPPPSRPAGPSRAAIAAAVAAATIGVGVLTFAIVYTRRGSSSDAVASADATVATARPLARDAATGGSSIDAAGSPVDAPAVPSPTVDADRARAEDCVARARVVLETGRELLADHLSVRLARQTYESGRGLLGGAGQGCEDAWAAPGHTQVARELSALEVTIQDLERDKRLVFADLGPGGVARYWDQGTMEEVSTAEVDQR